MIEGLHFDLSGTELNAHLALRVAHHADRAAKYRESLAKLSGGEEDPENTGGMSSSGRSDLTSRAKAHENKANLFTFMEKHLVASETYRLSEQDLRFCEILDRY